MNEPDPSEDDAPALTPLPCRCSACGASCKQVPIGPPTIARWVLRHPSPYCPWFAARQRERNNKLVEKALERVPLLQRRASYRPDLVAAALERARESKP